MSNLNFTVVPVNFERKKLFDDWDDMKLVGKPVLSKYSAKFQVDYDTDYIIRVSHPLFETVVLHNRNDTKVRHTVTWSIDFLDVKFVSKIYDFNIILLNLAKTRI